METQNKLEIQNIELGNYTARLAQSNEANSQMMKQYIAAFKGDMSKLHRERQELSLRLKLGMSAKQVICVLN